VRLLEASLARFEAHIDDFYEYGLVPDDIQVIANLLKEGNDKYSSLERIDRRN
jgi:hypothetical protein